MSFRERIIEPASMQSPEAEKQKTAFWAGSLNSGGIGIDVLQFHIDFYGLFLM
ncbi:hypothetical protein [Scandinavium sp.]|uniref:hypothetical protein n=1 Tax=Scandinavium sp. TaxID=2830653 RepID=UPI002897CAB1|nr:hypothetical protein [Scandinavium sp.]